LAKFKYKFNTIKEIKQRFEKKVQKELAVIDLDIASTQKEILKLQQLIKEQKIKKIENKFIKLTDLHFYEKYESYLKEQIQVFNKHLDKKKIERKKKFEELIKRSKETKIFEKLEEKHFEDFKNTQEKLEQKEMDEIAVKEYFKD
jgi:flagellar FliJ protein